MKRSPCLLFLLMLSMLLSKPAAASPPPADLNKLPIYFEANIGQADPTIAYLARGLEYTLAITEAATLFQFPQQQTLSMRLLNANPHPQIVGNAALSGYSSYFRGSDPAKWHTHVPHYAQVQVTKVYPGIDMVYHGNQQQLQYDFIVATGADPRQIQLHFDVPVVLTPEGRLHLERGRAVLDMEAPIAYQEIAGQKIMVESRFILQDAATVGFALGTYDPTAPLIIDPTIVYLGYLGGGLTEIGFGIAADSQGSVYITGMTSSLEDTFPVLVGPDLTYGGEIYDAFVVKLNPAGTALEYAGYIGGAGYDQAHDITLDAAGNAYVVGITNSDENSFPVIGGPDLTYNGGNFDGFIAKIDPTGANLVFAGYLGGSEVDSVQGIVLDASNNIYLTGGTGSDENSFPVLVGPDLTFNGGYQDAFITKLDATGSTVLYSGYIGGINDDSAIKIDVDSAGNAYLIGTAWSDENSFPVTVGPDLTFNGDIRDVFVAKVNPAGSQLLYAGYVGGNGDDQGVDIAVDAAGNAYITGAATSAEDTFPVTVGPDLTKNGGINDAFIGKLNPQGTSFDYLGYIGGEGNDVGYAMAIDSAGNAYVTGDTDSTEATFPAIDGPDLTFGGTTAGTFVYDAFLTKVNPTGTTLIYSTFIGADAGGSSESSRGITLDQAGNVYVLGWGSAFTAPIPANTNLLPGTPLDTFVIKFGTLPGSITLIKDASPDSPQSFDFTGDLGNFTLSDDGSSLIFDNLSAGTYTVAETSLAGWTLQDIACTNDTDASSVVTLPAVSIDLDAGEAITCTFTNQADATPEPTPSVEPTTIPTIEPPTPPPPAPSGCSPEALQTLINQITDAGIRNALTQHISRSQWDIFIQQMQGLIPSQISQANGEPMLGIAGCLVAASDDSFLAPGDFIAVGGFSAPFQRERQVLAAIGDVLLINIPFQNPKTIPLNQVVIQVTFDSRLTVLGIASYTTTGQVILAGNQITMQGFTLQPGEVGNLVVRVQLNERARPGDVISIIGSLESPDASIHLSVPLEVLVLPGNLPATGETQRGRWLLILAGVGLLSGLAFRLRRPENPATE